MCDHFVTDRRCGFAGAGRPNNIAQARGQRVRGAETFREFHRVVAAELRLLFVEGLAHRAVDWAAGILAPEDARSRDECRGDEEDSEQKEIKKTAHGTSEAVCV